MLGVLLAHPYLFSGLIASNGVAFLAAALIIATRYRGSHRGNVRSAADTHRPRHAKGTPRPVYTPRHEVATAGAVELGHHADGDITLVHAPAPAEPAVEIQIDDEPTVQLRGGLVTA